MLWSASQQKAKNKNCANRPDSRTHAQAYLMIQYAIDLHKTERNVFAQFEYHTSTGQIQDALHVCYTGYFFLSRYQWLTFGYGICVIPTGIHCEISV